MESWKSHTLAPRLSAKENDGFSDETSACFLQDCIDSITVVDHYFSERGGQAMKNLF